jgi:hypothetical protein
VGEFQRGLGILPGFPSPLGRGIKSEGKFRQIQIHIRPLQDVPAALGDHQRLGRFFLRVLETLEPVLRSPSALLGSGALSLSKGVVEGQPRQVEQDVGFMVNRIDLPTEIERFGQVFFCQSQIVIDKICCAEKLKTTNVIIGIRVGTLSYFLLFICQFKGAFGTLDGRLTMDDGQLTTINCQLTTDNRLPCHEQKTQGAI